MVASMVVLTDSAMATSMGGELVVLTEVELVGSMDPQLVAG
jgi:hypothetical protein